jgi:hypothetical protein
VCERGPPGSVTHCWKEGCVSAGVGGLGHQARAVCFLALHCCHDKNLHSIGLAGGSKGSRRQRCCHVQYATQQGCGWMWYGGRGVTRCSALLFSNRWWPWCLHPPPFHFCGVLLCCWCH